jgi:RHS repeat-associated protein
MHEHLPEFNLINMNGRVYDPLTAMFLSPDPYLQAPGNWLNYNRYAYCLNNPMLYTDPDGEFFLMAVFLGAMINTAVQGFSGNLGGQGSFWKAMGIGALSGAAGYGVGAWAGGIIKVGGFAGGSVIGAAGGAAGSFVGGAGNAWANGASFRDGLKAGLIGGGLGALGGAVLGGISGGITAYRHGGNLLTGEGATFISDAIDSQFGVVEASESPLNTNEKVTQVLNEKGVKLSDYNVSLVDVESNMLNVEDKTYTYWRSNGRIFKVLNSGGEPISIAGTTVTNIDKFRAMSDIYMSTHNTIPNFMKTLNHEFIHAWQFARFGHINAKEWNAFKEASAYRYTRLYYPSVSVPQYNGLWFPSLYQWPKLPSVY